MYKETKTGKNYSQVERQGKVSKWLSIWTELSLVAQTVKRLPSIRETWVQSLGQEDPLEKEMATHSSILSWRIQWTEEPGRLQSMGSQRVGHDWATSLPFTLRTVKIFTHEGRENCIPDRNIIIIINKEMIFPKNSSEEAAPWDLQRGKQ